MRRTRIGNVTTTKRTTELRIFTGYSKQRKLEQRYTEAGRCRSCGRKRKKYRFRCDECQAKERKRFRAKHYNKGRCIAPAHNKEDTVGRQQMLLRQLAWAENRHEDVRDVLLRWKRTGYTLRFR